MPSVAPVLIWCVMACYAPFAKNLESPQVVTLTWEQGINCVVMLASVGGELEHSRLCVGYW